MDILFQEQNKLSEKAVCFLHYMFCGLEIYESMKDLNLMTFIRQMPYNKKDQEKDHVKDMYDARWKQTLPHIFAFLSWNNFFVPLADSKVVK